MTTIHIRLDDTTYAEARRAAEASGRTVEELAAQAIAEMAARGQQQDPLVGWLADEPQIADAIDDAARRSRQERYGEGFRGVR
jgi:predicted transcriptional regulator